jgi:hypothetical protein
VRRRQEGHLQPRLERHPDGTITVGPAYAPHSISLSVPEGKINYVVANVPTQVVFSYAKKVWFYDHTWDDLVDVTADGDKGTIARCMSGLNAGQVARIGLKRVIVYGLQK